MNYKLTIFGLIGGFFIIILLFCFSPKRTYTHVPILNKSQLYSQEKVNPSVQFFDEDDPPSIRINASERVCLSNDPYTDLLLMKPVTKLETSTTDGSIYSDEEELSDFDNDSIRQLEWDCLEKNLTRVLDGDDRSSTTGSRLGRDDINL